MLLFFISIVHNQCRLTKWNISDFHRHRVDLIKGHNTSNPVSKKNMPIDSVWNIHGLHPVAYNQWYTLKWIWCKREKEKVEKSAQRFQWYEYRCANLYIFDMFLDDSLHVRLVLSLTDIYIHLLKMFLQIDDSEAARQLTMF